MKNYVSFNSVLYNALLTREGVIDGDRLIAVYSILKHKKAGRDFIRAKGKLKGIGLLSKETGLARKTLKTYLPTLEKMGLCNFSSCGDFYMLGTNKINKEYKSRSNKNKYIRVVIGKSIAETAFNSYKIRIHALEKTLQNRVKRVEIGRDIIARFSEGRYLSSASLKRAKRYRRKNITFDGLLNKVQLSIMGFGKLKTGNWDALYAGQYWKRKLVKSRYIISCREYKPVLENGKEVRYTSQEFKIFKQYNPHLKKMALISGKLCEEQVATFKIKGNIISPEIKKEAVKPKRSRRPDVDGFDFLAWWADAPSLQ